MTNPVDCPTRTDVAEGMEVLSADKRPLGHVRGLREKEFLLCDAGAPVVLVPYAAIESVSPPRITLQVPGMAAGEMGWDVVEAMPMPSSPLER